MPIEAYLRIAACIETTIMRAIIMMRLRFEDAAPFSHGCALAAQGFSCNAASAFAIDFGRFDLAGPAPLVQRRTCVSGQPCAFENVTGLYLSDGDRIMILDTCGLGRAVAQQLHVDDQLVEDLCRRS